MKKRCVDDALRSKVKNSNEDQSEGSSGFRSVIAHFCSKVLPSNFMISVLSFGLQLITIRRDTMNEKTKRFFMMQLFYKTVPGVPEVFKEIKVIKLIELNQSY